MYIICIFPLKKYIFYTYIWFYVWYRYNFLFSHFKRLYLGCGHAVEQGEAGGVQAVLRHPPTQEAVHRHQQQGTTGRITGSPLETCEA